MNIFTKISLKKIKKLPSVLLGVFICIIVIVAIIISANKLMDYISIKQENELLKSIYDNKIREIDELKYYINTEVDDAYKERMARLFGYCYPDEIIYYVE